MNKKQYFKFLIPVFITILLYSLTAFIYIIPYFKDNYVLKKKEIIEELVVNASGILEQYHKEYIDSIHSLESAQELAKKAIDKLRYGKERLDYFWITDTEPKMIMHPYRHDLINKNLSDYKDPNGVKLFVEAVDIVKKNNEGFINYMWQWKNDSTRIVPKVSFVKLFKPWGWIIGTGIYIEDVNEEISHITNRLVVVYSFFLLIISLILFFIVRENILLDKKKDSANNELIENEKKLNLIFNTVLDGILIISSNGIILEANNRVWNVLGYDNGIIGKSFASITPPNIAKKIPEIINTIINKGELYFEISINKIDGTTIPIEVRAKKTFFNEEIAIIVVGRDISERKRQQQDTYNAIINAEEKERNRIAKELHDGVSPIISTIKLYIHSLKDCSDVNTQKEILNKIDITINESIRSISDISNRLSPHLLENFGLIEAIKYFATKIADNKNINIEINSNIQDRLKQDIEITLYRISIELLNNTLKYANASNISLFYNISKEKIRLSYLDNGVGFNLESTLSKSKGMGLYNIMNRIKSINGIFDFQSSPNQGIKINIEIPNN